MLPETFLLIENFCERVTKPNNVRNIIKNEIS